jgi:hypothetical protein
MHSRITNNAAKRKNSTNTQGRGIAMTSAHSAYWRDAGEEVRI